MTDKPTNENKRREVARLRGVRSFTVLELMTVVGIIAILVAMFMPVAANVREKARVRAAETMADNLYSAFDSYHQIYSTWPMDAAEVVTHETTAQVVNMLRGRHEPAGGFRGNNRTVVFMEFKERNLDGNGNLLDPWGSRYRFRFDQEYDHRVQNPFGGSPIRARVIVWSPGRDKQDGTADDVKSW
jgi:type II secretory pathway pseudopilin PulG